MMMSPLFPLLTVLLTAVAQVTRAVFEAAKGRLKVVGRAGVGVDNVDLAAATEVCGCCATRCLFVVAQQGLMGPRRVVARAHAPSARAPTAHYNKGL